MNNKKYENLVKDLVMYKDLFNMFNIQEAANECGVTEMTIRNFEKGKSYNFHVFCFYLNTVLYNFKYNTDDMVKEYNEYVKKAYEKETEDIKNDLIPYFSITRKDVIEKYRGIISKLENMED